MAKAETAPEPQADEALRTDQEAEAKLDGVVAPPAKVTKLRRRGPKPPANLGEEVAEFGVKIRNISIGKPIANVQVTITMDLDRPQPGIGALMGQHAYTGVFGGGFLGEGLVIKEAPRKIDAESRVIESLKLTMPRFDSGGQRDQIETNILPLLGDKSSLVAVLHAIDGSWRLNCPVDIPGALRLHRMQETFDLTKVATTEAEDKADAALDAADAEVATL
jgi:hypothetical protein